MNKHLKNMVVLLLVFTAVSCSSQKAAIPEEIKTLEPTQTPKPTLIPTNTPEPTQTLEPTLIPINTPNPNFVGCYEQDWEVVENPISNDPLNMYSFSGHSYLIYAEKSNDTWILTGKDGKKITIHRLDDQTTQETVKFVVNDNMTVEVKTGTLLVFADTKMDMILIDMSPLFSVDMFEFINYSYSLTNISPISHVTMSQALLFKDGDLIPINWIETDCGREEGACVQLNISNGNTLYTDFKGKDINGVSRCSGILSYEVKPPE